MGDFQVCPPFAPHLPIYIIISNEDTLLFNEEYDFHKHLQRIFVKQIFTHQATQNQQTYKNRHIRFKAMKETRSTFTLPSFLVSVVYQQPCLPPCCASLKFPTILLKFQEYKLLVFQRIFSDFAVFFHAPHSLISTSK